MDHGLTPHTCLEILETHWNPYCQPPWQRSDLASKVANAARYMQNEAGSRSVEPASQTFAAAYKTLAVAPDGRYRFKTEEEMDTTPNPEWIVPDVLMDKTAALIYGSSGHYKSFLALDLCLSIASGMQTFGELPLPGPTFYAATEGRFAIEKARRLAWRAARGIEGPIPFHVGPDLQISDLELVQDFGNEIKRLCAGRTPRCVVLDTYSQSMGGFDENSASDANKFIRFARTLIDALGCAVLTIHHTGKDGTLRGANALWAGMDTCIEIISNPEVHVLEAWIRKHRDAEARRHPYTFEGVSWAGSLVLNPTTPERHRQLTTQADLYEPKRIGAALRAFKAFGEEAGVSTIVVATEITPQSREESLEQRQRSIHRTASGLASAARGRLSPYCVKQPNGYLWYLPEKD